MSAPKITEQEKQILRNNAKTELERLEACLSDQGTVQLLDMFKTSSTSANLCIRSFLQSTKSVKESQPPLI